MSARVVCIWLPNWPSQRIAAANSQADSSFNSGPVVLFATDARRGRIVAAANSIARQHGIVPQMPITQVGALCPTAHIIEHDPSADIEGLCSLAELLQCFSPIVGIESLDGQAWAGRSLPQPQAILLDVTGIVPLYGGEQTMAASVQQWFASRSLMVAIGIGDTVGSAWALANYAHRNDIRNALHSIDLGTSRPHDHFFMASNETNETDTFNNFSIEAMRLDNAVVAKLHRLGIQTIGPLFELPRTSLTSRFGEQLLTRMDQLSSGLQESIRTQRQQVPLEHTIDLEHPTSKREILSELIQVSIHRVCELMEKVGEGATRIVCRLELERGTIAFDADDSQPIPHAHVIQLSLFQPTRDPTHLAWLLLGQLEIAPPKINREILIKKLRLEVTLSAPIRWQQDELFDAQTVMHRNEIARLIDALSMRVGRAAIVAPVTERNPLPEQAFRLRPLTGVRVDGEKQKTQRKLAKSPKRDYSQHREVGPSSQSFGARPLTLLRKAKALQVIVNESGGPACIDHAKQEHIVHESIGPERIESGWWAGATQRRDYYRVSLTSGAMWWIYRDLIDKAWYMHGEFD